MPFRRSDDKPFLEYDLRRWAPACSVYESAGRRHLAVRRAFQRPVCAAGWHLNEESLLLKVEQASRGKPLSGCDEEVCCVESWQLVLSEQLLDVLPCMLALTGQPHQALPICQHSARVRQGEPMLLLSCRGCPSASHWPRSGCRVHCVCVL